MRRLAILFALMLFGVGVSAQATKQKSKKRVVEVTRSFTADGKAVMLATSSDSDGNNHGEFTWKLTNERIKGHNIVFFEVCDKWGLPIVFKTWDTGARIKMTFEGDEPYEYEVFDGALSHLRIMFILPTHIILCLYPQALK